MKKTIFLIALFAAPLLMHAQDQTKTDDDRKKEIINKCVDQMKANLPDATDKQITAVKDFCSCSTDNMLKELKIDEVEKIYDKNTDQATQQALGQKVLPLIQPCLETLQTSLMAQ